MLLRQTYYCATMEPNKYISPQTNQKEQQKHYKFHYIFCKGS